MKPTKFTPVLLFLSIVSVSQAQMLVIDDFQGYADTNALRNEWSAFGGANNGQPYLALDIGTSGNNTIQFDMNWDACTDANLLYTGLGAGADLSNYADISFSAYVDTTSPTFVKLVVQGGTNNSIWQTSSAAALELGEDTFSGYSLSLFDNMEVVTNNSDSLIETISNVTNIRLRFESGDSSSGLQSVFVDNITAVPEPSSIALLLGLGSLGFTFIVEN